MRVPSLAPSRPDAAQVEPLRLPHVGAGSGSPRASSGPSPLRAARAALAELFGPVWQRSFAVRDWDGSVEVPRSEPRFTVILPRPWALRRMLLPPSELAITEAFVRGDLDVEGDLLAAVQLQDELIGRLQTPRTLARVMRYMLALPKQAPDYGPTGRVSEGALRRLGSRHSAARDAAAVRSHYDLGNDFYALWLGRDMLYSCAYFPAGSESLDEAQDAKLEYICRKLRLRPGETLLDIGCGWGSLVRYAAERYGVYATGFTLSEPQAMLARERLRAAGLDDRAKVEVRDYRDFQPDATFDKVVSVGMLEHVGRAKLLGYFQEARRLTRPGGLFLAHAIVDVQPLTFGPASGCRVELGVKVNSSSAMSSRMASWYHQTRWSGTRSGQAGRRGIWRACGSTTLGRFATGYGTWKRSVTMRSDWWVRRRIGYGGCIWPAPQTRLQAVRSGSFSCFCPTRATTAPVIYRRHAPTCTRLEQCCTCLAAPKRASGTALSGRHNDAKGPDSTPLVSASGARHPRLNYRSLSWFRNERCEPPRTCSGAATHVWYRCKAQRQHVSALTTERREQER